MSNHTYEAIRNKLAVMIRGEGIAYFNNVSVIFNPQGEFNVFNGNYHCKYSTTTSLKEAIKHVQISLG